MNDTTTTVSRTLTDRQRLALSVMTRRKIGAFPVDGRWIFREGVRRDPAMADIVIERYGSEGRLPASVLLRCLTDTAEPPTERT